MARTLTPRMLERGEDDMPPVRLPWDLRALELGVDLFPDSPWNAAIAYGVIEEYMFNTWRGDETGTIPEAMRTVDQLEDYLAGQAVKAVLRIGEDNG